MYRRWDRAIAAGRSGLRWDSNVLRSLKKSTHDWVGRDGEERTRRVTFGFRLKRRDGFDWSFPAVDFWR